MRNLSVELRPKTFSDFIGADSVINPILEGIKQGRVDSAYMFSGQKGSGKTSLARVLAKYVQGQELEDYDIEEINTANCNTADDARELVQRARFNPWIGKYKVFILDEAQRMTTAAQQILLKDLEEPNPSLIWMPCTSDPSKIDPALRRRCGDWRLRGLYPDETKTLILASLSKLDKAIEKKYTPQADELSKALVDNNITSPGFIIRALEKFITGVPAIEAAQVSEVTSVDTMAVMREVVKGNWSAVQKLLQKATAEDGRGIRAVVTWKFRTILLKAEAGSSTADISTQAIHELTDHSTFEDGLQLAATIASIYKICKLIKN